MSIHDTKYEEMLLPCTFAAPLPPEAVLSPGCGLLWLSTCLEGIPLRRKEIFSQMMVFPSPLSAATIFPSICWVSQELMASSRCNKCCDYREEGMGKGVSVSSSPHSPTALCPQFMTSSADLDSKPRNALLFFHPLASRFTLAMKQKEKHRASSVC